MWGASGVWVSVIFHSPGGPSGLLPQEERIRFKSYTLPTVPQSGRGGEDRPPHPRTSPRRGGVSLCPAQSRGAAEGPGWKQEARKRGLLGPGHRRPAALHSHLASLNSEETSQQDTSQDPLCLLKRGLLPALLLSEARSRTFFLPADGGILPVGGGASRPVLPQFSGGWGTSAAFMPCVPF